MIGALFRLARPVLHALDPEVAHRLTIQGLKTGLLPRVGGATDPALRQTLWSREFPNPVGLAAGFVGSAVATTTFSTSLVTSTFTSLVTSTCTSLVTSTFTSFTCG